MTLNPLSSGDLIADRRAQYARMLADGGDHAEAADLMTQALELVPDWPAGWFRLADYEDKSGGTQAAVTALRRVLELNPEDIFGAGLKLSLLGGAAMPDQPSSRYVAQLFDDYADRFDRVLVEKLGYSVPEKLSALITDHAGNRRFANVVDLGCGTGLFGERVRNRAERLEGFDLSANMLARAGDKRLYDHLARADLLLPPETSGVFAQGDPGRADLASAADVLMYLGNLDTVFAIARALLSPDGLFAFSVEDADEDRTHPDFVLRLSLRYAHSQTYVTRLCAAHGLDVLGVRKTVIRNDGGKPLSGILFLTCKRA